MGYIFIGGGGHARVVFDALGSQGEKPEAYCDPVTQAWLAEQAVRQISQAELDALLPSKLQLVMAFLGLTPEALFMRYQKMKTLKESGAQLPSLVHASAIISPSAVIEEGAQVLTGAIIQAGARIGACAVINTGAVVEHGVTIGAGAHVAPRAVVLGDASIGECTFIGAGAVVIQQAKLEAQQFVKALTTFR